MKNALQTKAQPRGEQKRRLILDTTLRLIATGGVDAVTHRRVAEAAGIPLGSTTYYFDSREQLLREAFVHYVTSAREMQARLSMELKKVSVTKIVNLLVDMTEWEFEDEDMMLTEYELTLYAARDEVVAKELHAWDDTMIRQLADALSELGAQHPDEDAKTLLHVLRGYELDRLSRHKSDKDSLRRRLRRVVSGFLI